MARMAAPPTGVLDTGAIPTHAVRRSVSCAGPVSQAEASLLRACHGCVLEVRPVVAALGMLAIMGGVHRVVDGLAVDGASGVADEDEKLRVRAEKVWMRVIIPDRPVP